MKRTLALLLVVLLTISMVACSTESKPESTTPTAKPAESESTPADAEQPTDESKKYYVSDEKVEYEFVWIANPNFGNVDEMEMFNILEEMTNLHINWISIPRAAKKEKMAVMFADNDLPDAFWGRQSMQHMDAVKYGDQGIMAPLEDYVEECMPNMMNVLGMYPEVYGAITSDSGHIYSLPRVKYGFGVEGFPNAQMYINKQWMDNLNLEMPKTTDDIYNVLKAFKEQDADGDGDATNEIPYSVGPGYKVDSVLLGSFGVLNSKDYLFHNMADKRLDFMANSDEYKAFLSYINKLSTEGLLDPESFTQDVTQFAGRASKAEFGMISDWGGNPYTLDGTYVVMPMPAGPNGDRMTQKANGAVGACNFAITTQCKDIPTLLRWADIFYDADTLLTLQFEYGPLGINIEQLEDGTIDFLPTPEDTSYGKFKRANSTLSCPGYLSKEINDIVHHSETEKFFIDAATSGEYLANATTELVPSLTLSVEESSEMSIMKTDLVNYIKETTANMMAGKIIVEDEWDKYVAQLDKLQCGRYEEIYNAAYQRYLDKIEVATGK